MPGLLPEEADAAAQRHKLQMMATLLQANQPSNMPQSGMAALGGAVQNAGIAKDQYGADMIRAKLFKAQTEALTSPQTQAPDLPSGMLWSENGPQWIPGYLEAQERLRRAGSSSVSVNNEGNIPPGYQAERDEAGRIIRLAAIPGSPAAREADDAENQDRLARESETSGQNIIADEIDQIFALRKSGFLPDAGVGAATLANFPNTDARAINGLLNTVKARIGFDELGRMRQASPTGGALGNITEREIKMLQAIAGELDQSHGPLLERNLARLWNASQDVIHGPNGGPPRMPIPDIAAAPAGRGTPAAGASVPAGVDPELWEYMTPEERKLWQ
jgi:hypothetical protein